MKRWPIYEIGYLGTIISLLKNGKVLWPKVLIVFNGCFNTLYVKLYVTCHKTPVVYDIKMVLVFKRTTNSFKLSCILGAM